MGLYVYNCPIDQSTSMHPHTRQNFAIYIIIMKTKCPVRLYQCVLAT